MSGIVGLEIRRSGKARVSRVLCAGEFAAREGCRLLEMKRSGRLEQLGLVNSVRRLDFSYYLQRLDGIISRVLTNHPQADISMIVTAFDLAWRGHLGQFRDDGSPYIDHVLWVAEKAAEIGAGAGTIAAALCHELVEDVGEIDGVEITLDYLAELFDQRVAQIIDGKTNLSQSQPGATAQDDLRKWVKYGARDLSIVLIGLLDRWHNILTLEGKKDPAKRVKKALETLQAYVPIAYCAGSLVIYAALADKCLSYTQPEDYLYIRDKADLLWLGNNEIMRQISEMLEMAINGTKKDLGCRVRLEPRGVYELHGLLESQGRTLASLKFEDVLRCVIVVPEQEQCYLALARLHNIYRPTPGSFIDRVAISLPNGNRFLQTTVGVPLLGEMLAQIRSEEMDHRNRWGIFTDATKAGWHKNHPDWLTAMADALAQERSSAIAWQTIASLSEPIYVYSPKGEKIQLSSGATVLDYAAKIHWDVLLRANSATVNSRPVNLNTVLRDGDRPEIFTGDNVTACLDWLTNDWVSSKGAKQAIRTYLRREMPRAQRLAAAIAAFDRACQTHYFSWEQMQKSILFSRFLEGRSDRKAGRVVNPEDIVEAISTYDIRISDVINELVRIYQTALASIRTGGLKSRPAYFFVNVPDKRGLFEAISQPISQAGFFTCLAPLFSPSAAGIYFGVHTIRARGDTARNLWPNAKLVEDVQQGQIMYIAGRFGPVRTVGAEEIARALREKAEEVHKIT